MKTKKENKIKNCSKCKEPINKKTKELWAVRFPYWICRKCGLKAKEAFNKIGTGKISTGIKELVSINQGVSEREANKILTKTKKRLENPKTRQSTIKALKTKGLTEKEITNIWKDSGLI